MQARVWVRVGSKGQVSARVEIRVRIRCRVRVKARVRVRISVRVRSERTCERLFAVMLAQSGGGECNDAELRRSSCRMLS